MAYTGALFEGFRDHLVRIYISIKYAQHPTPCTYTLCSVSYTLYLHPVLRPIHLTPYTLHWRLVCGISGPFGEQFTYVLETEYRV